MRLKIIDIILAASILLSAISCGQGKGASESSSEAPSVRSFPIVHIPAAIQDLAERAEFLSQHYWDDFFAGDGPCDSAMVLGVPKSEVAQAFSNYTALISPLPLEKSDKLMHGMFSLLSKKQQTDTSSLLYTIFTDIVTLYLYDPNSPMRNEDLFLPFVQDMAASPFSREEMKAGYEYQAWACSLNRRGSVAPDFRVTTLKGRTVALHSIKAKWTLLFFSNPGCQNCREIGAAIMSNEVLLSLMNSGELVVFNVYIDEELGEWRKYAVSYPEIWVSGYDSKHLIRDEHLYDVRAIPSLYLLDSEKRVMLKDAPPERVIETLLGQ